MGNATAQLAGASLGAWLAWTAIAWVVVAAVLAVSKPHVQAGRRQNLLTVAFWSAIVAGLAAAAILFVASLAGVS
jgi:hypothetical protein